MAPKRAKQTVPLPSACLLREEIEYASDEIPSTTEIASGSSAARRDVSTMTVQALPSSSAAAANTRNSASQALKRNSISLSLQLNSACAPHSIDIDPAAHVQLNLVERVTVIV